MKVLHFEVEYTSNMNNFWGKLKKPVLVLAPMADVTDEAFRQVINKYGKPDVFFTEFTSADGLCHPEGRKKLMRELYFTPEEKPIVAQLFSSNPEKMREACALVRSLGFDGIDINMGCPDKTIEKQGCGSAMIRNPERAKQIIQSAKEGAPNIPISVKTRIGYNKVEIEEWTKHLLEAEPAVITFHFRTRKEMSKVPAHWELANIPVELAKGTGTLIFGNGDVKDIEDARRKASEYGLDGIMLGRAIYGNPWLFSGYTPTTNEKLEVMIEHVELFEKLFLAGKTNIELFGGHTKGFHVMKKHFKAYVEGFDGAHDLRVKLMETESAQEMRELVEGFLK